MKTLATILLLACASAPCLADPIDMTTIMEGPDAPIPDCRKSEEIVTPQGIAQHCLETVPLTLARLCVTAAALPDRNVSLVDQTAHGALARRLLKAGKAESLTAEEVSFLKSQIAKLGYNTMVVSQAVEMLDPNAVKK